MRAAPAMHWSSVTRNSPAAKSPASRCATPRSYRGPCRSPKPAGGPRNSSHNLAFTRFPPMASHLDLEEQEQLDDLKAFWKQYGNLVTWVLVLALGGYAAWNGWNYYLRDQGAKAGVLYDEIDRAAQATDSERATRIFADMKERYPRAVFTQQAGLLAARVAAEKGQYDAARASLGWVAESGGESEYRS